MIKAVGRILRTFPNLMKKEIWTHVWEVIEVDYKILSTMKMFERTNLTRLSLLQPIAEEKCPPVSVLITRNSNYRERILCYH